MLILVLKTIHVLGAVLFLGTGIGSAYYKFRAVRSSDVAVIAWCDREIVMADWVFTVPSGVLMPTSGLWLAYIYRLPVATPWIWQTLLLFAIAGITWLPAAYLQIRMRRLSVAAKREGAPLPGSYHRMQRIWALLGLPSFSAVAAIVWLMVSKQSL